MSVEICVLSVEEAGRLEHWGVWPSCKAHHHMKLSKAQAAVSDAMTHRFVGGPDTKVDYASAIVPVDYTRMWSPVACHDETGKAIAGMRSWGLRPIR